MSFKLLILGSNSSLPAYGRHHTAQLLKIHNQHFLIDCGEGTQYQFQAFNARPSKIDRIFISHLHGDHYLGLMGIIFSLHLSGRDRDLTIYGQKGLKEIITTQLKYSQSVLNYSLHFVEITPNESYILYEDDTLEVMAIPLIHRSPCTGFLFKEKTKPRKIKSNLIPEDFPIEYFDKLKNGEDILDDEGNILYRNSHLTMPPKKSRSYAFCSDTGYNPDMLPLVNKVDLMYHEATFLKEKEKWARQTYHSTTHDAAQIAKEAGIGRLLIGHFSARYKDITPFVEECREVFENTDLALEGEIYTIKE